MTTTNYLVRELACGPITLPQVEANPKVGVSRKLRDSKMRLAYLKSLFEAAGAQVAINEDSQLLIADGARPSVPGDQSQRTDEVFTVVSTSAVIFEHQQAPIETDASALWEAIAELHAYIGQFELEPTVITWVDYGVGIGASAPMRHYAVIGTSAEETALNTIRTWLASAPMSQVPSRLRRFKAGDGIGKQVFSTFLFAELAEDRYREELTRELAKNESLTWLRNCADNGQIRVADNMHLSMTCSLEIDAEIKGTPTVEQFRAHVCGVLDRLRQSSTERLERPCDPGLPEGSLVRYRSHGMATAGALTLKFEVDRYIDRSLGIDLIESISRMASKQLVQSAAEVRVDGRVFELALPTADADVEDIRSVEPETAESTTRVSVEFDDEEVPAPLRAV